MPRVIAIMNQKGGVGKTTTTLNLGAALAQSGKRVLLVDLDPQANLTIGLGKRASDLSVSVYELLTNPKVDTAALVMQTDWERLHIIPSHIDLSGAEIEMVTMIGRETRLSKALDAVRGNYDYVLIDCLPSLSLLTVNAMAAATEVFVPLQAHPFALEGLGKLFEVVGMIREAMNPSLRVSGVLVTMFDGRTNVSKVTLENLRRDERLREHIFTTTIKQNIKVAESQKEGVPVTIFDPHCHAAKAYQALCLEVLEMEAAGCSASQCGERITAREKAVGAKLTFTADLLAPASRPAEGGEAQATPAVAAEPAVHVAPVTALVGNHEAPAPTENAAPAEPSAETPSTEQVPAAQPKSPADLPEPHASGVAEIAAPQAATIQAEASLPPDSLSVADVKASEPIAVPVAAEAPRTLASSALVQGVSSPDVAALHSATGISVPASLAREDAAAAIQMLQSRAPAPREFNATASTVAPDLSSEDYRPRLQLRPGSVNLPPLGGE